MLVLLNCYKALDLHLQCTVPDEHTRQQVVYILLHTLPKTKDDDSNDTKTKAAKPKQKLSQLPINSSSSGEIV